MKTFLRIVIAVLPFMALSGCYYDIAVEREFAGEASFSRDVIPIFNQSCNNPGCHASGGPQPDLTPDKAYNALKSGNYINVASPESSELYQWMLGQRNTPMPLSGPNPVFNATVLAWIRQGASNN